MSYQDDGSVIMKAVCNGTPFTIEKVPHPADLESGTAMSADRRLTLEAPITTAADDIHKYFFTVFQSK